MAKPQKCPQQSGVWSLQDSSPEVLLTFQGFSSETAVYSFGNVHLGVSLVFLGVWPSDLTIHQQVWLTTEELTTVLRLLRLTL